MNLRKLSVSLVAGLLLSMAVAMPALAQGDSEAGLERYLENPGRQQATEVGAQCGTGAGSGAFGFLGRDNSMEGGANGPATGTNNSALCGNRP